MTENAYQKVVDHTTRWIEYLHKVTVKLNDIPRGMGFPATKEIELPLWINKYDVIYRIYYVVHELVHCIVGHKHDATFMKVEDVLLALWDIKIVRKKVYPKMLFWREQEITNIPGKEGVSPCQHKTS